MERATKIVRSARKLARDILHYPKEKLILGLNVIVGGRAINRQRLMIRLLLEAIRPKVIWACTNARQVSIN